MLVAPRILPLSPSYMEDVLVYGFTAAVLGGLDSPVGALIGGLVIGLARTYVSGYIGATYEVVGALVDPHRGAHGAARGPLQPGRGEADLRWPHDVRARPIGVSLATGSSACAGDSLAEPAGGLGAPTPSWCCWPAASAATGTSS